MFYSNLRIYDFDGTIYDGNSTWDFYLYLLRRYKRNYFLIPVIFFIFVFLRIRGAAYSKTIETIYKMLHTSKDVEQDILNFWKEKECKIKKFYLDQKTSNDIIVSASPEPLLKPIVDKLGAKLVASKFDTKKKAFVGNMCIGAEKVKRLNEMGIDTCDEFFTDSLIDAPMIKFSRKSYLVEDNSYFELWSKF